MVNNKMETGQYKNLFISETLEILSFLNNSLVRLEKMPADEEILNEIFRQSHTLKGMAATMGYEQMVRLTHQMESVLELLRGRRMTADQEIVNVLFASLDALEEMVKGVRDGGEKKIDAPAVIERLNCILANVDAFATAPELRLDEEDNIAIAQQMKMGMDIYKIMVTLSNDCQMKEARAFIVLKALQELGRVISADDIVNQIKAGKCGAHFELFFATKKHPDAVKENIEMITEVDNVSLRPWEADKFIPAGEGPLGKGPEAIPKAVEIQTVRVGVDKLDSLMNLIGELVINKIRLAQIGRSLEHKELDEALTRMGRLTTELQDEMMQVRLLPLEYLFNHFPRMVRDLALEQKKEAELFIKGAEIGLDRSILDAINDPLIHLLRNAVTHGIEEPQERKKIGKPPAGQIRLIARRERNFAVIEVSDDGCGIDAEEIRQTAAKRNFFSQEEVSRMSDEEAMLAITLPGFTITEKITETAGRGMGMNIVRTSVEGIGGALHIKSKPGEGSKFTLKLPLTMAIVQGLLVAMGEEIGIIPLTSIAETLKIDARTIKIMEHHEIIAYRDTVLPLVKVRERLGFGLGKADKRIPVVVVEVGYKKAGLIVDALLGQQEVVIKTMADPLKKMKGIAGATILGNGKVALILDVSSIIS